MRHAALRPALLVLAALLGVLVVVGTGAVLPARTVPAPAAVPVSGTSQLVCPVPQDQRATLSAVAPGAQPSELQVTGLDGVPVADPSTEDGVLRADLTGTSLLVAAEEAAGSVAGVVTRSAADGSDPGLSQLGCAPAGSGAWLVGLRSGEDEQAAVVLTNPDQRQAVVNLTLHDEDGQQPAQGSRDLVVPARSTLTVELGPLLTATGGVAVQVQTTTGRVAAVGRQRLYRDDTARSSEWVAPGRDPAATVVLPGVPGGEGARRLVLFNPGERRAQVSVEALGSGAPFVPAGVDGEVDVPARGTATVELDEGFSTDATTLRLRGSQPVAASLLAEDPDGDLAVVTSTAALEGAAVGVAEVEGAQGRLVLANPGGEPARARVLPLAGAGGQEVEVAGGSTVVVTGGGLGRVEVLAGELHGAVVLASDDGLSSAPLVGTGAVRAAVAPVQDPHLW
ncbi:hypothetical protein GC722_11895 [Auraticoccus sp. F435]|uniref:Uncharacterized protein n=1 Tax=Auraticoccus cholistanensis TaxID=2656650 RepID=A0A6A9V133_9ACTN|nr:DUF5719 family protein [Auraticoccus cholistanensis]MVA76719.1 hypothetical protein [Auraticoccus cholistanensis]